MQISHKRKDYSHTNIQFEQSHLYREREDFYFLILEHRINNSVSDVC